MALIGGGITLIMVSPGLIAKLAPEMASKIGLSALGQKSLFAYSQAEWLKFGMVATTTTSGTAVTVIAVSLVSIKLFEKLNEEIGPKGFKAWKTVKINQVIREDAKVIPTQFENDPVLSQNICSLSQMPLRVPCRSIYGHYYEEAWIKSWISQQMQNNIVPQCPLRCGPLTHADLIVDINLSDTIELRLLLLQSQ